VYTKNVELGPTTRYNVDKPIVRKRCDIAKAYRGCQPITAKDFMQVHATVETRLEDSTASELISFFSFDILDGYSTENKNILN